MKTTIRYTQLFVLLALLGGCTHMQQAADIAAAPVKTAKTLDQKAHALYASFTIAEEAAAELILDARVPDSTKLTIQRVDNQVKEIADTGHDLVAEYTEVKKRVDEAETGPELLVVVTQNLDSWINDFEPLLKKFQAIIAEAL